MKVDYEAWRAELLDELKYLGLNVSDAFDAYSFGRAYEEYGLTPREAVHDYLDCIHQMVRT